MSPPPTLTTDSLAAALLSAEADVERLPAEALRARVLPAPHGKVADLATTDVEALLAPFADPRSRRAALASFARGLATALAEPTSSRGADESFAGAAATLMPALEGPLFAAGALASGAEEPLVVPFAKNIVIAYQFELDQGVRLVSKTQLERWAVHQARLEKAALSILFHRTWGADETPVQRAPGVVRYGIGDGVDAARALVLDNALFDRCRRGLSFAIPASDRLLLHDGADDEAERALRREAERSFDASPSPLTLDVFRFVDGRLRAPRRCH